MVNSEKVREDRLRRMAARRGYSISKSRRRDALAVDFGRWRIVKDNPDASGPEGPSGTLSLEEAEEWLDRIVEPSAESKG